MEKAEKSRTKFRFSKNHLIFFLTIILWIIIFLTIQYLARESDYSNVEVPEDNDKYIFWPLLIILAFLLFRNNMSKSSELSEHDTETEPRRDLLSYIIGSSIFLITYLLLRINDNNFPPTNYSDLFSLSLENFNYIIISTIVTLMISIMRYPWDYSSDDD